VVFRAVFGRGLLAVFGRPGVVPAADADLRGAAGGHRHLPDLPAPGPGRCTARGRGPGGPAAG